MQTFESKDVIFELLENLVYDAVYEHHGDLEQNQEFQNVHGQLQQILNSIRESMPAEQQKLLDELLDKVYYMISLAELNSYKFGIFDGVRLLNLLNSGEILRCGNS
jgi:hypothetical protein